MSKLIMQGNPLLIIPSLAMQIGLNEAIFLQQVHYWLSKKQHMLEGKSWVYNTYEEWNDQMPFWSVSTIKRIIKRLEQNGLLISGKFNTSKMDQTKWYTIDYDQLEELILFQEKSESDCASGQHESSSVSEGAILHASVNKAIPEITTEITNREKKILSISSTSSTRPRERIPVKLSKSKQELVPDS
ncbi:replication protein [Peribacillus sp. SCS-155]|uniref:replication protein n=1 Tax=Peribacillus sedimenti TaxID=3115297 RepID=UPI003906B66D